ncbi:hypothetical protein GOHSU_24_00120 [Gordonia hirsuta DSM 44140 = NBRC 16056]|uniref:Uncharacterized protein n=1 Tax=Gordonia hirsuta DSM 44140 = NBRC 16056 TaxID=1121927 RepID=L7LCF7_9ACTN|nr:DUF6670 family protein [Gordonia hirsuta]GAC57723.1 hypothetical protein GOHSU_24_00120 [Gordonia hirsuta DSM 44140 = NBRC 16056]
MAQIFSSALARLLIDGALPLLDSRLAASTTPYTGSPAMIPHVESRARSMVHYGIFVPKLPEPYRYLNTMTLIGSTGTEIFDNDALVAPDARNTTTVLSTTAADDQYFYRAYDAATDCDFAADGSHLRWGGELTIDVAESRAHILGRYPDFSVELTSTITDQVSYFIRTPIYDHLSLLAPFEGTITDADGTTPVSGLGTFEYAHAITPQALTGRPFPGPLKLPADFFTYQIIELDERTQLLLTCVSVRGAVACLLVHIRVLGESTRVLDEVTFEVGEYADDLVDEWGRPMRMPAHMRWIARQDGREVLRLDAVPDSTWRFGHGRGYVGAYSYAGRFLDDDVTGSGYIEWVDTQRNPRRSWGR